MAQLPVQNTPQTQPASTGQSSPGGPPQGQSTPAQPSAPSTPSQPSVPSKPSLPASLASRSGPTGGLTSPTGGPSLPSFPKPKLFPIKLPLLLALVALVAVSLGIGLVIIQARQNRVIRTEEGEQVQTPDFSITLEPETLVLGAGEEGEIKAAVQSKGGFSDEVSLTPIFEPGIGEPFIGILGSLIPNRIVKPPANGSGVTVIIISASSKIPKLENGSSFKNLKVEGKSGDLVRYSNIVSISTRAEQ